MGGGGTGVKFQAKVYSSQQNPAAIRAMCPWQAPQPRRQTLRRCAHKEVMVQWRTGALGTGGLGSHDQVCVSQPWLRVTLTGNHVWCTGVRHVRCDGVKHASDALMEVGMPGAGAYRRVGVMDGAWSTHG
jgi:hypothetical protein